MKVTTLQNFRAMQLAIKGACGQKTEKVRLEGIDCIPMGSDCEIIEVPLNSDHVVIKLIWSESESYLPLHCLSDDVIEELTNTMKAKALELGHCDVAVNGKGELSDCKQNRR